MSEYLKTGDPVDIDPAKFSIDIGMTAPEAQVRPLPPIRDALTQQQFDTINEERIADEG